MKPDLLRDAWFLAVHDLFYNLRRRETMVWAFVMPIVFFYFVGTIMSGSYSPPAGGDNLAIYAPGSAGPMAQELIRRLELADYRVTPVGSLAELREWDRQLALPAEMTESVRAGKSLSIQFTSALSGINADYDRIRISRAIAAMLSPSEWDRRPQRLTLSVRPAGQRKEIPTGFEQSVPGSLVFFILMALLTNGVTLTIEREQGILRRLASSPMSRGAVVAGKWAARMALGGIQVAFALLTGTFLFHVSWGAHLWAVIGILLAYAGLAAVFGMLLGNFGRTQRQVIVMGAIASNLLASLGGCWWPIEVTPKWCQTLAHWIPSGIAMDALHQLMSFGAGPGKVAWQFSELLALALAAGCLLAWKFRFQ